MSRTMRKRTSQPRPKPRGEAPPRLGRASSRTPHLLRDSSCTGTSSSARTERRRRRACAPPSLIHGSLSSISLIINCTSVLAGRRGQLTTGTSFDVPHRGWACHAASSSLPWLGCAERRVDAWFPTSRRLVCCDTARIPAETERQTDSLDFQKLFL